MTRSIPTLLATGLVWFVAAGTAGCGGKEYVRGTQDPTLDDQAMSTGLDKRDLQKMLSECLNDLRGAPVMNEWRAQNGQATVAIFRFRNETDQHVDPQLAAMASEAETWLVNAGVVQVVDQSRQQHAIAAVEGGRSGVFDPNHVPQYGKQLGVKYYLTGDVQNSDERTDDARRTQYFMAMEVLEVETGLIKWRHKSYVTKAVR